MQKAYFPMFVDLSEKRILIVGAGRIAARRAKTLLMFADNITVIAPEAGGDMEALIRQGKINWLERKWQPEDLDCFELVLAATDDREVNSSIGALCREKKIVVNVADDKSKCDFYFPGIVQKDDVIIGISTSGNHPEKARAVREALQKQDGGD